MNDKESTCKKFVILGIFILLTGTSLLAQPDFSKGVNLTNWFQTGSARQIQFTKFTRQDFVNIKSLGCDVIRLPINLHAMTLGAPEYTIDPLFISFLDTVVNWANDLKIYLLLDNHSFDPSADTQPGVETILKKVWKQLAEHYKNESDFILYEILNEPHGISTQQWGQIQQSVIDAIRAVDVKHTIVVGGSGFNSYNELKNLPVYTDSKLIYTFHFYDPFLFTHQGATWVTPSMAPLSGVPFPYAADKMPVLPSNLAGSWIESNFNAYPTDGTVAKVKSLIDIAVDFKNSRKIKVFCGEFGVFIPNSNNDDRVYWYEVVRKYLEENGIPWTTWDYTGEFGLFKKGSGELFDYDINTSLVQSLGLTAPPQKTFTIVPDSAALPIYRDYIEKGISESGSSSGILDYYNTARPNNGKYCIYWTGAVQYNTIGFDFRPDKDLSRLVSENYALDFFIRGSSPGSQLDLRFLNSRSGTIEHPWRMRYTLDENAAPCDRRWHHVFIPLKAFTEQGAWDNGWFEPQGKFNWNDVDRFEIDAEYGNLNGREFWIDNLCITNQDTAQVMENGIYTEILPAGKQQSLDLNISPNPVKNTTIISYYLTEASEVNMTVFSATGQKKGITHFAKQSAGLHRTPLNSLNLPSSGGVYLLQVTTSYTMHTVKIICP